MVSYSFVFEKMCSKHMELLLQHFEIIVCAALDVLPGDLQSLSQSLQHQQDFHIINALGVAAGTQLLETIHTDICTQFSFTKTRKSDSEKNINRAVVLHSLSDLILTIGRNETVRFLRKLAHSANNEININTTIVCVLHEALHEEREKNFWRDFADQTWSTDIVTGAVKQHSAKKIGIQFRQSKARSKEVESEVTGSEGERAGAGGVIVASHTTNPEDFEDEDDPDDDLDL